MIQDKGVLRSVRKTPDAPGDEELSIRLTYSRTYKFGNENYVGDDCPDGRRTMLGKLLFDLECIDKGHYMLDEAIDLGGEGLEITIELVDEDGRVYSEYYDVPGDES